MTLKHWYVECPECDGNGYVERVVYGSRWSEEPVALDSDDCPQCKGAGDIRATCFECGIELETLCDPEPKEHPEDWCCHQCQEDTGDED